LPEERTRFTALQYEPAVEFALVAAFETGVKAGKKRKR
jgi:hypothetical protein